VDVIQTEGAPSISTMSTGLTAGIEKAAPALAATYVLSRALAGKGTHVMAASGMNEVTAPMALVSGAQGVGVGTAITSLGSEAAMATKVREIVRALQRNKVQMH
jgi:thiamine monophosphate synthase